MAAATSDGCTTCLLCQGSLNHDHYSFSGQLPAVCCVLICVVVLVNPGVPVLCFLSGCARIWRVVAVMSRGCSQKVSIFWKGLRAGGLLKATQQPLSQSVTLPFGLTVCLAGGQMCWCQCATGLSSSLRNSLTALQSSMISVRSRA
jgi:hypothetical protein